MSVTITALHTEATRDAILEAAGGLFLERRIDGFSVQEVADRAGLTHRTVYRYFPTRQELLHATVERLAPGISEDSAVEPSGVEEWLKTLRPHFARTEANFEIFRGLVIAAFTSDELARSDPRLRDREMRRWKTFRSQFPRLPEQDAWRTFAALRHLTSSASYVLMRLRFGMSPVEASHAIQAAARHVVAGATSGERRAARARKKR